MPCMARQPKFDASMRFVVLHGKDSFLLQRYAADLEVVLAAEHGEIDRIVFDGNETDLATVLDEVRTFDLLAQHKLVIVDAADVFLASKDGAVTPRKGMERYAEAPVDSATLLLRAETWRPGNLDKIVKKVGLVHKIQPLNEIDTVRWCVGRAGKEHGCELDASAADLLVRRIGLGLTRLDSELGKLAANAAPRTMITHDDVVEMVGLSREEQAWEIQSVMLGENPGAAMSKLGELLDVSRQPRELMVWAIVDLARRLHAAAAMLAGGSSPGEIRKALRLFGSGGDRALDVARRGRPEQYASLFSEAVAMDGRMRSGLIDPRRGLELLLLRVCHGLP